MRLGLVTSLFLVALAGVLSADTIGLSVNGTCEAGSCPAMPLPVNSTSTLPVDINYTLPDGDMYLINGSFTNASNGVGSPIGLINHLFQVTYEGNGSGGPSADDTITVEQFDTDQTTLDSVSFYRDVIGAFGSGIASSSSVSSCVNGALACVGPVGPPGSFGVTTGDFTLDSINGTFTYDATYVNVFGAGSAVGSYIVWNQTTALPPPTPEPASLGLLALGLGGIALRVRLHRVSGC